VGKKNLSRAVLYRAMVVALLVGGSTSAWAAGLQAAVPAAVSQQAPVSVNIAAQPLHAALDQFALQTDMQVVYAGADIVRDLGAPAVKGTLTPDAILRRLLEGSGLQYEFVNAHTVSIHRPSVTRGGAETVPPASVGVAAGPEVHMDSVKVADLRAVTVTGTNLRNIDPASPLIMIDAQQIELGGYSSIEDVLRHLPQNFSSRTSTSVSMGESEYGDSFRAKSTVGTSSVNLRGLGSGATLVLVNGRRMAGSAQGQGGYTDISSIPLAQVERIEVLTDGASAIYGADAVAGVVNIVLKKSYEGTLVQLRHEDSSNGADASRLDLAHTFGWSSGYLTASGSFRKSKPADTARFIHVGPSGLGDFTDRGGVNGRIPDLGQPGVVFTAIDYGYGTYFAGSPLGIIPGGQNGNALQPGDLLPYDAGKSPSSYWTPRIGPEITTPSLRIAGEQDLGHDLKLSYGASYARQRNERYWHPIPYDFGFISAGSTTYVPATNIYNHFGQDVMVGYSYDREFSGMTFSEEQRQTNQNFNLGLSGKLPWTSSWEFELGYNDSRERGRSDSLGGMSGLSLLGDDQRLTDFVNNVNVFGDGSDAGVVQANRDLLNALVSRYESHFSSHLRDVDLLVRGDLFALPGGNAQLAVGAQARDESYHTTTTLGGLSVADADRKVHAVYGELGLPLLKDVPGVNELTLTLAARYESFDQQGGTTLVNQAYDWFGSDPMDIVDLAALGGFDLKQLTGATAGDVPYEEGPPTRLKRSYSNTSRQVRLSWKPVADLRLRATWGQSFLTPQALQQFGQDSVQLATYAVMFNGGQIPPGVTSIISINGPNANLKPQLATVRTIGFDYSPAFATGLTVSATYNDTRFNNYIGDPLAGMSYADIFSDISKMPKEAFTMGENGVLLWDARQVNFLGRRSRSIDGSIDYGFDNSLGDWSLRLNAVRTLRLEARTLPSFPTVVFSDSEFGPSKWAGDLFVSWNRGNWMASAGAHYSSAFRVLYPMSGLATVFNNWTPDNPNPRRHAASYTTADFQVGYNWQKSAGWLGGTTVRLGMQNAFDREFPFVDNQYGFISNRVNVRGRVIYLDLKKEF
jgi:outer membrane receptor protein involved in Fe transport